MKTMTCADLGGPCELAHRGASADDVITAQDRHLKEAVAAGDTAHEPARTAMKDRWKHPRRNLSWYLETKRTFAALPEEDEADSGR